MSSVSLSASTGSAAAPSERGGRSGAVRPLGGRGRSPGGPGLPVAARASPVVRGVDGDVSAAVGRVLDEWLAGRVARAGAVDGTFAADLAHRVADFTGRGGKRVRARLLWWAVRACGGPDVPVGAALATGAALELLQTCALVQDDVMDGSATRRGRRALHVDVAAQYAPGVGERGPRTSVRPRASWPGTWRWSGPTTWPPPRGRSCGSPNGSRCGRSGRTCGWRWWPASTSTCTAR